MSNTFFLQDVRPTLTEKSVSLQRQKSTGKSSRGDQPPSEVLGMWTSSTRDPTEEMRHCPGCSGWESHCTDTEVPSSWWTSLLSKEPGQEPHPKAQTRKWLLPCRAESPWEDRFLSAAAPAPTWLPGQWEPQAHSLLTPLPPGKKLHAPTLPCLPSYFKLSGCQRGNAPALLHLPPHCLAVCEDW